MRDIIELGQALEIVARDAREAGPLPVESVPLAVALGRVLARDVVSSIDSPPFDKSAMDGFALAAGDTAIELRIRDTIPAGAAPDAGLRPGECARIMTGAMLPSGSDRVVRKEFVEERNGLIRIVTPEPGDNVVRLGSSLARGGRVLGPKVLAAQDIGILAASGAAEVFVSVPLSTGIICTGPEIRQAGATLGPGQIYDSNGPQLAAQLAAIQVPSRLRGIVPDEPEALSRALADAFAEHDLVLLTGGVSEGDFDFVPRCLEGQGAEILFHGVAVKPGKPTLFARLPGGRRAFGLPGNPVSTFVIFEVFVKPYLLARMGADPRPLLIRARTGAPIRRRNTERAEFLPVRVREGAVTPVPFHGSAHLNALGDADGLVLMAKGVAEIPGGTEVDVRPI